MGETSSDPDFWEAVYQSGETRFDLRGPTLPLVDYLDLKQPVPGRALVPGCGRGHDVLELARRGFQAVGIDFAPSAIHDSSEAAKRAGLSATAKFEQRDLFALTGEPVDLWWENTCYCAIEPNRRDEYAGVASRMIRSGGVLLFLVFPVDGRAGGPPFAIDPAELKPRFGDWFELESIAAPRRNSTQTRAGKELLAVLVRKS